MTKLSKIYSLIQEDYSLIIKTVNKTELHIKIVYQPPRSESKQRDFYSVNMAQYLFTWMENLINGKHIWRETVIECLFVSLDAMIDCFPASALLSKESFVVIANNTTMIICLCTEIQWDQLKVYCSHLLVFALFSRSFSHWALSWDHFKSTVILLFVDFSLSSYWLVRQNVKESILLFIVFS